MKILLVNDDGIGGPGLLALVRALKKHDLTVVAPMEERSGFSMSMTYYKPIEVEKRVLAEFPEVPAYAVSGTPLDCTKLGLRVFAKDAQLVVSGINCGANLGTDIAYSGTFGAAMEAAMYGVPAIAVSQRFIPGEDAVGDTATRAAGADEVESMREGRQQGLSFEYAANFTGGFVDSLGAMDIPKTTVININIPPKSMQPPKGIRITRPGILDYGEYYEKTSSHEGRDVYRLCGALKEGRNEGEDVWAVQNGYISITPLMYYAVDEAAADVLRQTLHDEN